MSLPTLFLFLLGAAAVGLAVWSYLHRGSPVPGRALLLGLRVAAVAILVLLLVNPTVPVAPTGLPGPGGGWVLLDPDLSLAAGHEAGGTHWDSAVARAIPAVEAGRRLAVLGPPGTGPEGLDTLSLRHRLPVHPTEDLLEGVLRLAEAGADTVQVLAPFRMPPGALERLREATPVPLVLEPLMGTVRNAGVGELELPAAAPAGEEITGRIALFHEGTVPGDTLEVVLEEASVGPDLPGEGAREDVTRTVGSWRLPAEEPRGSLEVDLRFPAPVDTGQVRYVARVHLEGDRFPPDDARVRRIRVGDPEGGILLISLTPDWEGRTLLPVLEEATGLHGQGFLRVGADLFLPLVPVDEAAPSPSPELLREQAAAARLLVVHGVEGQAPSWLAEVARTHPRVLHLARDAAGAGLAGVTVDGPRGGEWTVDPDLPASPVAPFLEGMALASLPPLARVLPLRDPATEEGVGTVALRARGPGGERLPVVLLRAEPQGHRVVVLAAGFWRWGTRSGEPRQAYRSLWGGVADWLLAGGTVAPGRGVRPEDPVQERGRPLRWLVPGDHREVGLVIRSADPERPDPGDPVFQGALEWDEEGRALTPPLPPGTYRYGGESIGSGGQPIPLVPGVVEVEAWAPSLMRPPLEVPERLSVGSGAEGLPLERSGRPLRTWPLPWLMVIAILCAEWIGRRRLGLR